MGPQGVPEPKDEAPDDSTPSTDAPTQEEIFINELNSISEELDSV